MKLEKVDLEISFRGEIASHQMDYEDIRTLAAIHYEKTLELEEVIVGLRVELTEMTRIKIGLEGALAILHKQYDSLAISFEEKSKDFISEKTAHRL